MIFKARASAPFFFARDSQFGNVYSYFRGLAIASAKSNNAQG
jgi:hypothetical protein